MKNDNTIRTKFDLTGNAADAAAPFVRRMPKAGRFCPQGLRNPLNVGWAPRRAPSGGDQVSGFGRIVLLGAIVATVAGIAGLRAQTQLADPKDAPKIFASTCSACHKSPQGLAKSGQVAGFLRQHYTTGPEMSAAMAAYLVAAGSAPAKKDREKAAARVSRRSGRQGQDQEAGAGRGPAGRRTPRTQRTLRGKQLQAKSQDDRSRAVRPRLIRRPRRRPMPQPVRRRRPSRPRRSSSTPRPRHLSRDRRRSMTLDIPLPEMPTAPPADLTQSVFSSSPVP